jgi:trehalose-phosphatase
VTAARVTQPTLRVLEGKRVHDFQPDLPWDKGHAVRWLMSAIDGAAGRADGDRGTTAAGAGTGTGAAPGAGAPAPEAPAALVPLYIGDDVTDEDAFRALAADGITVAVLDAQRPTAAQYRLGSTDEVRALLAALAARLAPQVDEG